MSLFQKTGEFADTFFLRRVEEKGEQFSKLASLYHCPSALGILGVKCENCIFYVPATEDEGVCKVVDGPIGASCLCLRFFIRQKEEVTESISPL